MAKVPRMEMKCDKCGNPQSKNKEKSNENWNVFDCNQKCGCGGKFVMYINGQKLG